MPRNDYFRFVAWPVLGLADTVGFRACTIPIGARSAPKQQLNPPVLCKSRKSHIGGSGDRFGSYRWFSRTGVCSFSENLLRPPTQPWRNPRTAPRREPYLVRARLPRRPPWQPRIGNTIGARRMQRPRAQTAPASQAAATGVASRAKVIKTPGTAPIYRIS